MHTGIVLSSLIHMCVCVVRVCVRVCVCVAVCMFMCLLFTEPSLKTQVSNGLAPPRHCLVFINPHVCVCVCVSAHHRTRPQTPSEQRISPTKTCSGSPSPRGRGIEPWCRPQQTRPQTAWHTGPTHSHHKPSLAQNGYVFFSLFCLLSLCVWKMQVAWIVIT